MNVEIDSLIPQKKLAERLKVAPKTIRLWATVGDKGKILARRMVGKRVYYHPDDVLTFLGWTEKQPA